MISTTTEITYINDAELAAAFRAGIAQRKAQYQAVMDNQQPKVDTDYILIAAAHEHMGLRLDLYGEYDEVTKRTQVYDIALSGSKTSLWCVIDQTLLNGLSEQFN